MQGEPGLTLTVNSPGDEATPTAGSTTLSLREAIEIADGTLALSSLTPAQARQAVFGPPSATPVTIVFDTSGTGPLITLAGTTVGPTASAGAPSGSCRRCRSTRSG